MHKVMIMNAQQFLDRMAATASALDPDEHMKMNT